MLGEKAMIALQSEVSEGESGKVEEMARRKGFGKGTGAETDSNRHRLGSGLGDGVVAPEGVERNHSPCDDKVACGDHSKPLA